MGFAKKTQACAGGKICKFDRNNTACCCDMGVALAKGGRQRAAHVCGCQAPQALGAHTHPETKKVCVPQIGLKFPAPLLNFMFCRRNSFLMWVGGWGGWPGPARAPNPAPPPPPPGSVRNGLIYVYAC